ncbi:MAG: type I restriction enzyme HsdR N-terminal domain-containing protein, partial [Cohaesibacteraceae bacterium]|nr:type I restriction enzyme HsdR N-terminal domain-containing protein [Cohaesibacteraceae bacterium]
MDNFWNTSGSILFEANATEAEVETRLVLPLLEALGYDRGLDIASKKSVSFHQGRKPRGRPNEADFVLYNGSDRSNYASLMVVEAKRPKEKLEYGQEQAESYAFALRAPIYLLINGLALEIWQLQVVESSALIFDCTIVELLKHRGEIEALISKAAVIQYCKKLGLKNFVSVAEDTTNYISAEVKRTKLARLFIHRTLTQSSVLPEIDSSNLLTEFHSGALITGPSGYGKTELSHHLFCTALSDYEASRDQRIPLEIPLLELDAVGSSIQVFAHHRVQAHCPQITKAKFEDMLRQNGAIYILDGMERVHSNRRSILAAQISNVLRDFPKISVFVFSRPSCAVEIALSTLELQEFSHDQRIEFVRATIDDHSHSIIWDLPSSLKDCLGHPIFLKLLCEHYIQFSSHPENLTRLFEDWLKRALAWRDPTPAIQVQREAALSVLAERTFSGPLSKSGAYRILREADFDDQIFNALVESGALNISKNNVELVHEALADFLRAKHLSSLPIENFVVELEQAEFANDSLLAVLLMDQLPEHDYQLELWKRLIKSGIRAYLGVFRIRAETSSALL